MTIVVFLKDLMRRRKRLPSQLAADLGVSHATVRRWILGEDVPGMRSCQRLAEYSGTTLHRILAIIGYLPEMDQRAAGQWPEFREYAQQKYPNALDEDVITMIEDLIERRRQKKYERRK